MNAILVFDPSNDLLFVKSNPHFRCAILKFARANDLLDYQRVSPGKSDESQRATSGRTGSGEDRESIRESRTSLGQQQHKTPESRRRRRTRPRRLAALEDNQDGGGHCEDTSECYMDILMLLLTPYVASLRLANHMGQLDSGRRDAIPESDGDDHDSQDDCHESTQKQRSDSKLDGHKISTSCVPVECLENCQVVYCQLFDFIFVLMQELDVVSSFKMRLLKRRLDTFARLSLLLFGQCLNSLKPFKDHHNSKLSHSEDSMQTQSKRQRMNQSLVLRRAFDCWFEHQFEAEFFLEAHERLIVGSAISQLCYDTLRRVSLDLRRPADEMPLEENQHENERELLRLRHAETQQHAILFSGLKLVSRFSCPNAASPLGPDDLILLMVLLTAFNADYDNQLPDESTQDEEPARSRAKSSTKFVYRSHYLNDKQTYEIHQMDKLDPGRRAGSSRRSPKEVRCFCRRVLGAKNRAEVAKLPKQFPVFLAAGAANQNQTNAANHQSRLTDGLSQLERRLFVPHMLRFVALNDGITLVLISEISSQSYLSIQLSKAHKLLLELTSKTSWRDQDKCEPPPPSAASQQLNLSACGDTLNLNVADRLQRRSQQQQQNPDSTRLEAELGTDRRQRASARAKLSVPRLKLAQLTRANDCMQAIKSYFYRPDLFDLMVHEQRKRNQQLARINQLGGVSAELRSPDAMEALNWQLDAMTTTTAAAATRRRLSTAASATSPPHSSNSSSSFWSSSRFLAAGWRDADDQGDESDVVGGEGDLWRQRQRRPRWHTSAASLGSTTTSASSAANSSSGSATSKLSSFVSRLLNIGQQRETAKERLGGEKTSLVVESQIGPGRRPIGLVEFDEDELGATRNLSSSRLAERTACDFGRQQQQHHQHDQHAAKQRQVKLVIETLDAAQRKLCRHLLRKLGELAQSNMQTYMRQTFGLSVDEHKRDALLSSVCSVLRESLSVLVLQTQLGRLDGTSDKTYLNYFGARTDQARLRARSELSDYLDYLAVKASCNVTLNAPIAHDMPSVSAFIYLDRARQQLIVSQPSRRGDPADQVVRMNWRELLQADFMGAVERHERIQARKMAAAARANESQTQSESDLTPSDDDDHRHNEDDHDENFRHEPDCGRAIGASWAESSCLAASDVDADQSSQSSDVEAPADVAVEPADRCWRKRVPDAVWQSSPDLQAAADTSNWSSRRAAFNQPLGKPSNFTGTSQDVLIGGGGGGGTSSTSSMALDTSEAHLVGAMKLHANLIDSALDLSSNRSEVGQVKQHQLQPIRLQVDANLVKGFTAFIYNRLAQGQVENLTQKDGTYNLTYSMWFKRNSSVWSQDIARNDDV